MKHLLLATVAAALLVGRPVHAQLAEPNDAGVAFGHVHLYVEDVDLHGRLWSELFGGTLIEKDRFTAVELPGTLVFLTEEEGTTPSRGSVVDHFGLAVRDLGGLLDSWRGLAYSVDSEAAAPGGGPGAVITMPGGVRLDLREDPDIPATAVMDHVHLIASENRELFDWYTDLFGAGRLMGAAEGERRDAPPDETLVAEVPGSLLVFSAAEEERPGTEGSVIDHIGFEVEDMDAFAEMLRDRGVEFVQEPFRVEVLDLWVAFFEDPAGVLVEVTEGLDRY